MSEPVTLLACPVCHRTARECYQHAEENVEYRALPAAEFTAREAKIAELTALLREAREVMFCGCGADGADLLSRIDKAIQP